MDATALFCEGCRAGANAAPRHLQLGTSGPLASGIGGSSAGTAHAETSRRVAAAAAQFLKPSMTSSRPRQHWSPARTSPSTNFSIRSATFPRLVFVNRLSLVIEPITCREDQHLGRSQQRHGGQAFRHRTAGRAGLDHRGRQRHHPRLHIPHRCDQGRSGPCRRGTGCRPRGEAVHLGRCGSERGAASGGEASAPVLTRPTRRASPPRLSPASRRRTALYLVSP